MRVLIQRARAASVTIDGQVKASIENGLLVFIGIEAADTEDDVDFLVKKITQLRIFNDHAGIMNLNIKDVEGDILVISQFTLHASTKKGNRPSYIKAARPETAIPLYASFLQKLESSLGKEILSGEFGADMKVGLINDGPVTIWIDSKMKE